MHKKMVDGVVKFLGQPGRTIFHLKEGGFFFKACGVIYYVEIPNMPNPHKVG